MEVKLSAKVLNDLVIRLALEERRNFSPVFLPLILRDVSGARAGCHDAGCCVFQTWFESQKERTRSRIGQNINLSAAPELGRQLS